MRKSIGWSIAVLMAVAVLAVVAVPQLRWRAHLVLLAAAGKIPDLEWSDLLSFMSPSSEQSVTRLVETRNPYSVIRNPKTSSPISMPVRSCSRPGARSVIRSTAVAAPRGPALFGRAFSHGTSDWAVFRTIRYGVPDSAMQAFSLLRGGAVATGGVCQHARRDVGRRRPDGLSCKPGRASSRCSTKRFVHSAEPADEWLTYSGSYSSIRHSALAQIGPDNVDQLAVRWIYPFPVAKARIETSPIVRSGVMFVTSRAGHVIALDAASGKPVWQFERRHRRHGNGGGSGLANRGVRFSATSCSSRPAMRT